MPYIGRELDRGNYLKLDDISSSFNGSTTTFNLTNGGNAFYPGSAFSILVVLAGVVQEPEAAYQINQAQITFASAPLAGDQFFCIVLGQALGVNTPANGSVNGAQLAKPFNYDNYFYLDDANNRVGVGTATPMTPLHVEGTGRFTNVTVTGDLTVEGTTTTLDTVVTEVDKLEVGANNNTVGVAITQSGSGDAAIFMGGNVGINKASPSRYLEIGGTSNNPQIRLSNSSGTSSLEVLGNAASGQEIRFGTEASPQAGRIIYHNNDNSLSYSNTGGERLRIHSDGKFSFGTATAGTAKYTFNSAGTNEVARFESTDTGAYLAIKDSSSTSINFVEGGGDVLSLGVNNVERLRITTSGVGIGTDDPQSQFEVFGTSPIIRSKHSTSQKYTQINHDGTDGYLDWSSGGLIFRGASNTERFRITSAGVVKVGSNTLITPSTDADNFVIDTGDVDSGLSILSATTGRIYFGDAASTDQGSIRYVHTDDSMRFETNSSEKLRITSAGNIGIGENNPQNSIHISGSAPSIRFADTGANGSAFSIIEDNNGLLKIRNDAGNSGTGSGIAFEVDAAERLRIDSSGRLLLGSGAVALPKGSGAGSFDLDNGSITMCIGGNVNSTGRTNSTDKIARFTSPHYTNAEQPVMIASAYNVSGSNTISYGGGSNLCNTATSHVFYTAADTTTVTGTERFHITSTGKIGIGQADPQGDLHIGNISGNKDIILHSANNGTARIRFREGGAFPLDLMNTLSEWLVLVIK